MFLFLFLKDNVLLKLIIFITIPLIEGNDTKVD